ncbi:MAG: LysE family translocator [Candidatus Liberibacter europaeus]|uniref:LysE family translocator n=1 Tax=Candidatus Liberibacter europaeus TaxID=744859 RepID=A0A2T4VX36_9HYPH|nr:LysE family translocator [Candidatus Liberibacter europaeus]PTL86328.1 MAG: LysE family translocator [Candidatus Liberibacter europaeus]
MFFEAWMSFFIFAAIITTVPGPGCILTINHALQHGWRSSRMLILGQELAVFIIMITVTFGIKVISEIPHLILIIKVLGVSWLIYSAWSAWNSPYNDLPINAIPEASKLGRFIKGFVTDITNGKALALFVSVVPSWIDIKYPVYLQATIMTVTMIVVDTIVLLFYSILCSRLRLLFKTPKFVKIQNRVSAVILLLVAVKIIYY